MSVYYGLVNPAHLFDIVSSVCNVLGRGQNNVADDLLLETAAQETHFGQFRDPTPNGAGRGVFQCDKIAFDDVQARARKDDVTAVIKAFNFDLRYITHSTLDLSPLAAAVFARIHYKLRDELIPRALAERAQYWKDFYNTDAGDGTPQQYIANAAMLKVLRGKNALV